MRCKNNHSSCELCINAAYLLRTLKWTKVQRDILLEYQRLHLNQQAQERQNLENTKLLAKETDEFGKTKMVFKFMNAITNNLGDTPRIGIKGYQSGNQINLDKTENITTGEEVICGPICGMFLYHTDNFTSKGANIMIEVIRNAISDLAQLLSEQGLNLPWIGDIQMDNSGENKNKEMFAYFSLLVETNIMNKLHAHFFIVGHTHSSPDQYFSVMSKTVKKTGVHRLSRGIT